MMSKLYVSITDYLTGKEVTREMSAAEASVYKATQVESAERALEATARTDARISALAKLAKLGLTQAEIEAL